MEKRSKQKLTISQILVLGVILSICIGAILLKLPISNSQNKRLSTMDSIFTATSAVCVTGLNTIVPAEQFSIFGKIVLMILIEIGGVGFVSFLALLFLLMNKKIGIQERNLIKESLNQNYSKGIIKLIKKIFLYMGTLEIIGTIIFSTRFIPQFGVEEGIFQSMFLSVSATCNAGFCILGNNSLISYQYDNLIIITVMLLNIIGGLGFIVWDDTVDATKKLFSKKITLNKFGKEFSTNTKIVLTASLILLITGAFFTFIFEKDNANLMKNDNIGQKIIKSIFYSSTLRTAGLEAMDSTQLTTATKFTSLFYMFVGGSSGSTAGGIKTTTFAIIIAMVFSYLKGNEETVMFKRKIPQRILKRAIVVMSLSVVIITVSILSLLITENIFFDQNMSAQVAELKDIEFIDIVFEVFSAFGTTGITLGITSKLSIIGKIIIIFLMFCGKVGPITVSYAVLRKDKKGKVLHYPECDDLTVG